MEQIRAALAAVIGMDQRTRLHRLALADNAPDMLVERWGGRERLSGEHRWWVDVLALDAGLDPSAWLGRPARLDTRLADGGQVHRSGLVHEAQCLGSDGGLARFRIGIVPWTWWLAQGRHSRVFQERTVIEIVASVLDAYGEQAAWQCSEEVAAFLAGTRARSYCVQYRESDAAFLARLLAEEGLGWRIEEHGPSPSGHRLVIFADSSRQPRDATGSVRYHRSDATEAADTVQAFGARMRLGSGRLALLSSDYKSRRATTVQLALKGGGGASLREVYEPVGAHAFADSAEAERHARLMAEAAEAHWRGWQGRSTVRSLRAGTWLEVQQLPGGAESRQWLFTDIRHAGVNNLPVDLRRGLDAVLGPASACPEDPDDLAAREIWKQADAVGYANAFEAVDRDRAWRPVLADETGARLNPRPTAPGYQSAVVVGAEGAQQGEVHADALGRIRVKFHFQQGREADDRLSCWLRVAQRYAGPGVGSQFLPRVGQEVLVGFLEGDIDRPVVMGALYNGRGEAGVAPTPGGQAAESDTAAYAQADDHRPSAQANLAGGHAPAWHGAGGGEERHRNATALWGIKSKEWNGSGYSQLVFDDSDEQLRLQLATTQAATQLNLGHLIHQADNYRGSFRGEGFELRTDAWGAVRGQSGLWLTAYGRDGATAAGEAVQQVALLTQLQKLGQTFSQAATTHQTVKLAAHEGAGQAGHSRLIDGQAPLQALLTSVKTTVPGEAYDQAQGAAGEHDAAPGEGKVPQLGDPLLGLAAPAGIGLVAGQSLHWSVGETLTLGSGQGSEAAIAGDARLHSGQAIGLLAAAVEGTQEATTLSVVSGEGELDVQAQGDEVRLRSRQGLKVVSANAAVELAAGKTVHLATAGGASVTIEGGNITFACPGNIRVHAARKSFVGPVQQNYRLPVFPQSICKECLLIAARNAAPFSPLGGGA
jgi:type VI secretion system VgrG family protein